MLTHIHLHPIAAHFPIALFITALGLEILSLILKNERFHKTSWINYILGVLGAGGAILCAFLEHVTLKHPVYYTHHNFGYLTFITSLLSLLLLLVIKKRFSKTFRVSFLIILIIIAVLILITGYTGGRLVYEYGVGVSE